MIDACIRRYVPLLAWLLVAGTLVVIPLRINSFGYLPADDALRHAAKAVSEKTWPEVLVMRTEFSLDHNPGWHWLLGWIHRQCGVGPDGLVAISVIFLLLGALAVGLPWCHRPEAWAALLLLFCLAAPYLISRLALGRPFLLTMAALMAILFQWRLFDDRWKSPGTLLTTTLLMAASVWVHGAWYLFALPVGACFLAWQWRAGLAMAGCWLTGTLMGGVLTGHPWPYLMQAVLIPMNAFGHHAVQSLLVTEFRPFGGDVELVAILALAAAWRLKQGWSAERFWRDPIFMLIVLAWLAGLPVQRFWLDWGLPAALVWCAPAIDGVMEKHMAADSPRRLLLAALVAWGLFAITTSDLDGRWTRNLTTEYLTADNPEVQGWLPEDQGILYSSDMTVFYETFFKNPRAPWRYMLGFEPTFMPLEDLAILRHIHWNRGAAKAYAPWVEKMRPADRLVIRGGAGAKPAIPELEWHYAVTGTWVGRLPKPANAVPGPAANRPRF